MYEQRLPIEEWKAKKQAELKETIAAQRSALQEVVQDGQRLADYLYGRGRLGSHITSGNAALVLQTLPQARAVLTAKDWDKFGRRVNKGAKGIPQLMRVNGYYNVGSIFDVSLTYGNKPYPIPEIKPEQMDKAIKELERLSPVNIIFQNEGVVRYDAERHAIVFPTAMPQREVLARLPAEIVIATAEQHTPGISQAPYLRKTAMAVSVEFCRGVFLPVFLLHFGGHTVQFVVVLPQRCFRKARVEPVNAYISLSVFMAHGHVFHTQAIFDRVAHVLQFENKTIKAVGGSNSLFHIFANHSTHGGLAGLAA